MPTASSIDISGPPNAKQSSESCAMRFNSAQFAGQHVIDIDGRRLHHRGDRRNVVEMRDRQSASPPSHRK